MSEEFNENPEVKHEVDFGVIDASLNDVDLEHDQYPSFFLFKKGDKKSPTRYIGEMDYVPIKKFIFSSLEFLVFPYFRGEKDTSNEEGEGNVEMKDDL